MSKEAFSRLSMEHVTNPYGYETMQAIDHIAARIRQITSTYSDSLALALVTIKLTFEFAEKLNIDHLAYADPEASTGYLLQSLRPLVRKTDVIFRLDHTLYFLLLGANLQGGQIVQARLWDALLWRIHNTEEEIIQPCDVAIGHSAYPVPYSNIYEFIEAASRLQVCARLLAEKPIRKIRPSQDQAAHSSLTGDLPILARKLGIPYLSLLPRSPIEHLQQLINPRLAQELRCYPLGRERNVLTVAIADPGDQRLLERLHQETGLHIFPVLTHPKELQAALEQLV